MKKKGVILGYLTMILQNATAFILTPLLITVLGNSEFGVYKLALTIASYFALSDFGLSNSIIRYISEFRAKNDKIKEGSFIAISIIAIVFASTAIIALSIILSLNLDLIFMNSFSFNELNLLRKLLLLVVINGVLNLLLNLLTGIIVSYEKFVFIKVVNISKTFLRFLIIVVLLILKYNSFMVLLVDVLLTIIIFIISLFYCVRYLKININFKMVNMKFISEIFSYSGIVFIDALAYTLFWSADSIIIGIEMSSNEVGIYSIGVQIFSIFIVLSTVISEVLMPEVVYMVNNFASDLDLTNHMIKIGRIKLKILLLPLIGFIFFGKQFISMWVGNDYLITYYISIVVIFPSILSSLSDVGLFVMWAKNKHKIKSFFSLITALVNVFLTIILVQKYGVFGAAIGTSFAIIVSIVFNGIYFHWILKLNMKVFIEETFKKMLVTVFFTSLLSFALSQFSIDSYFYLIMFSLIVSLVYLILIWVTNLNKEEKLMILELIPIRRIKNEIHNKF